MSEMMGNEIEVTESDINPQPSASTTNSEVPPVERVYADNEFSDDSDDETRKRLLYEPAKVFY